MRKRKLTYDSLSKRMKKKGREGESVFHTNLPCSGASEQYLDLLYIFIFCKARPHIVPGFMQYLPDCNEEINSISWSLGFPEEVCYASFICFPLFQHKIVLLKFGNHQYSLSKLSQT